jgi:hypothetical protein
MFRTGAFLLSLGLLAVSLFAWSTWAPGFSYDEAWLGLFAHRISSEPHYRPWIGMSNYTSAFCQYLTAMAFRYFKTDVATFRAVGNMEVLLGVSLVSSSLAIAGESLAACALPAMLAFFPAFIMNCRWSVELTTFSILCAGLTTLGLAIRMKKGTQLRAYFLLFFGIVLGVTSHVMLLASAFPIWYCLHVTGQMREKQDRFLATALLSMIAIFLCFVYRLNPSHPEVLVGVSLLLAAAFCTWIPFPKKFEKTAFLVACIPGTLLFLPIFVYLEGHWLAKQFTGSIHYPYWVGSNLIPTCLLIYGLRSAGYRVSGLCRQRWTLPIYSYLAISLLITYSMVGRVGARFLAIPMLFLSAIAILAYSRLSRSYRWMVASLWIFIGAGTLWQNYLQPSIAEKQVISVFRLGRWLKDSSEDFLPKIGLVHFLSEKGCTIEDLDPKSRWLELQFMALGDWPPPQQGRCSLGHSLDLRKIENSAYGNL